MKKCKSCNIKFNTNEELCPLCQNKLTGECVNKVFPTNTIFRTRSLILKILLFVSFTIIIASVSLEMYFTKNISISLYIIGALLTNYVVVYYILKNRQNVLELIGKNGLLLNILLLLWYIFTKQSIITNFIIPIACLVELLFNSILFIILRKNYLINYFKLLILNMLLLFFPIILIILKWTTYNLLSFICFIFSLILLAGMLIFYFDQVRDELNKFFNV